MCEKNQNNGYNQPDNPNNDKIWARHTKKEKEIGLLRVIVLILIIIILLLLFGRCGYTELPQKHSSAVMVAAFFADGTDAKDGHLPHMTIEEIKEQMQKIADASYFSFKINARPVFENGSAKGNLNIENPSYNVYPMIVQIVLDDTGEMIYDSGGLYPDQHIGNAKLAKELEAGEYKATATMNAYDPETKVWVGKHEAGLIVTILN